MAMPLRGMNVMEYQRLADYSRRRRNFGPIDDRLALGLGDSSFHFSVFSCGDLIALNRELQIEMLAGRSTDARLLPLWN
jgi:hypothetical protein